MAELKPLTETERRVYDFVEAMGGAKLREVTDHFGWKSTRAAGAHLEAIERKGWVARTGTGWLRLKFHAPRAADKPKPVALANSDRRFSVPIAGYVAAGTPIPQTFPDGEELDLGRLLGAIDVKILQVRGDSMIEAHIMPGDYVAVRPCAGADDRRIVVAEIDGGHTLKVFRVLRGSPYLLPRNSKLDPIKLDSVEDPRLVGVYVALVRLPARVR